MLRLPEPGHCFGKTTSEPIQATVSGLPTQQSAGLVVRSPQPLHLAVFGAQTLFVGDYLDLYPHHVGNAASSVPDRNLEVTT